MRRGAILLFAVATGCGGSAEPERQPAAKATCSPTDGAVEAVEPAPAGTAGRIRLGPGMELKATKRNVAAGKGKRLVVSGTVRAEDCGPLAGATINAWQTNGSGRYGPRRGGRDLCCYLAGTALTGGDGRYRLDTVVPGAYGVAEPHIHMTVGHADARGLNTELVFAPGGTSGVVAVPVEDVRDGAVEFDIVLRDS